MPTHAAARNFSAAMNTLNLQIGEETVDQIIIDYQVTLKLSGGAHVTLESAFSINQPDGTTITIIPGDTKDPLGRVLELHNRSVSQGIVSNGTLRVEFTDGVLLECPPDQQFEAWSLFSPVGGIERIISTPGGELSIWRRPAD